MAEADPNATTAPETYPPHVHTNPLNRQQLITSEAIHRIIAAIDHHVPEVRARLDDRRNVVLAQQGIEVAAISLERHTGPPDAKEGRKNVKRAADAAEKFAKALGPTASWRQPEPLALEARLLYFNPGLKRSNLWLLVKNNHELCKLLNNADTGADANRAEAYPKGYPRGKHGNLALDLLIADLVIVWCNWTGTPLRLSRSSKPSPTGGLGRPSGPAFRFFRQTLAELIDAYRRQPDNRLELPPRQHVAAQLNMHDEALLSAIRRAR